MQAIMIVAHKNPEQILELCSLLKPEFNIYVHFDTKCPLSQDNINAFKKMNVNVYSKYSVKWGSYSICKAELLILKEALKNKDNAFFHLISGQDWPVKRISELKNFYKDNENIYLTCEPTEKITKNNERIIWWYKFYYCYDLINRRSIYGKAIHRILIFVQRLLHIDKLRTLPKELAIYSGSQWFDMPRHCVEYCLDYVDKHPEYEKFFSTSFCSDEAFFQTIIMNSPLKDKVVSDNHRYVLWTSKHGSYPAILDIDDVSSVQTGNYHFARKIDSRFSREFMDTFSNGKPEDH